MRITPLGPGSSRGADLVDLFKLHDVILNERARAQNAMPAAPSGPAPRAARQTSADPRGIGTAGLLASRAIRGRERFLHLMARLSAAVPSQTAAFRT